MFSFTIKRFDKSIYFIEPNTQRKITLTTIVTAGIAIVMHHQN